MSLQFITYYILIIDIKIKGTWIKKIIKLKCLIIRQ